MDILFEDNCILAINKPSGVVVNNSSTSNADTVQNFLKDKLQKELEQSSEDSEFYLRSGILHRLDKDTSGVLLVAKNEESFANLKSQFMQRLVTKEYIAFLIGEIPEEKMTINAPIARNPKQRIKMAVVSDGREAVTEIEKIKTIQIGSQVYTFAKISPKTGRTHQIRVHMSALGFPVVGDVIYCTRKEFESTSADFSRLMLHALSINFLNPCTSKWQKIESQVPVEFEFLPI